jgi:glycosyltransferase involved in cell wall biosynthesis
MVSITVITPTIGRPSLIKLIQSLTRQNIQVTHLMMWDKKREEQGFIPNDPRFSEYNGENYKCYSYVIEHPIIINRKDNYLRVVGLMMSNTDYITQLDDDCWIEDDWLQRAINSMISTDTNYTFCTRRLWEDENTILGMDDYESIGTINKYGYHLIETNSLVFRKQILDKVVFITYSNNDYGHDRVIANYLINREKGTHDKTVGLNQIVPGFLIEFHKQNIEKQNKEE